MQFIICKICGHTMNRGNRKCTRCKSKNLTFQEFYMQEDSFAMWQRLGRAQTPFTKTYASAGVSLLLVAVIATAAVGIYSHHTGVLKIGKPNLIAYKLK